jgi:hypothetical protein
LGIAGRRDEWYSWATVTHMPDFLSSNDRERQLYIFICKINNALPSCKAGITSRRVKWLWWLDLLRVSDVCRKQSGLWPGIFTGFYRPLFLHTKIFSEVGDLRLRRFRQLSSSIMPGAFGRGLSFQASRPVYHSGLAGSEGRSSLQISALFALFRN